MRPSPLHLKALEEIERENIPGASSKCCDKRVLRLSGMSYGRPPGWH
jgi:hypothetical protein